MHMYYPNKIGMSRLACDQLKVGYSQQVEGYLRSGAEWSRRRQMATTYKDPKGFNALLSAILFVHDE